jgi:hypothetical protein
MVGGAGCDEMPSPTEEGAEEAPASSYAAPVAATAFTSSKMAIGRLRANASALYFRLLDSASGSVLDHVTLPHKNSAG